MKKSICLLISFIMAAASGQAQQSPQNFPISQEDTSCRFNHSYPLIFPDGDKRFLVIWQDYRNGPVEYYAQLFDSVGNSVGNNFHIYSDADVAFAPDNSFLVLGEEDMSYDPYFDDEQLYLVARLCKSDGSWSDSVTLGQTYIPWCGTGWLGISYDLKPFSGGYLDAFDADGNLSLAKREWTGDTLWTWNLGGVYPPPDSIAPVNVSACFNSREDFAVVYYAVDPRADTIRGIAGTFFNSNDSVLGRNVILKNRDFFGASHRWQYDDLTGVPVSDSLYEVFALDRDSSAIRYWKVDRLGSAVGTTSVTALASRTPTSVNSYSWIRNFARSPVVDGRFSIFVSIGRGDGGATVLYNSVLNFDRDGNLSGDVVHDTTTDLSFTLGKWFATMSDQSFLLPTTVGGEIYLNDYRDFSLQWLKKVSDNLAGGNDLVSNSASYDDNSFFITWNNEKHVLGRRISNDGIPVTNSVMVPGDNLLFLPGGHSIQLVAFNPSDTAVAYGYKVYDSNFSLERTDTVIRSGYSEVAMVMKDTSFLILSTDGNILKLRRVLPNWKYNEISIPTTSKPSYLQIIEDTDSSFWVGYNNEIRLVTKSLNLVGGEAVAPSGTYLGNNRFLLLSESTYTSDFYHGTIVSPTGDTLVGTFPISDFVNFISCRRLSDDYFLVLTRKGNQIYVRTFNSQGLPRIDPLLVSSGDDIPRLDPISCQNGNKLLVSWSESRTPGNGFDVYGTMLDIDKITSVGDMKPDAPSSFTLFQNYPNPFNPSTTISYRIPAMSHVTLKIYDVLGREVATIVDEKKMPGTYEVKFDGSKFASGVYFCRMNAGNYLATKKLMLLK
ncbi:MAG TPA: T9SS type A sorting domain-containing protein [Candidatus Acidoferrales bacterium]|nr:T9SS type A sorting domain-containing protein [Candidatus Acidoferrales bacterium]